MKGIGCKINVASIGTTIKINKQIGKILNWSSRNSGQGRDCCEIVQSIHQHIVGV